MFIRAFLLCGVLLAGCTADVRPRIITAANVAESTLISVYEAQGDGCVQRAAARADAVSCVAVLDSKWTPVWKALADVSTAADALSAWCALGATLAPLGSAQLPVVEGVACP